MEFEDSDDDGNGGFGPPRRTVSVQPLSFQAGVPSAPVGRFDGDYGEDEGEEDEGGMGEAWPLEDGRLAETRPEQYGREWSAAMFHRQDILEADPDYQFLVLVAGAANTDVSSLYASDGIQQVVSGANRLARRALGARDTLRRTWQPYQILSSLLDSSDVDEDVGKAFANIAQHVRGAVEQTHKHSILQRTMGLYAYVKEAGADGQLPEVVAVRPNGGVPTPERYQTMSVTVANAFSWMQSPQAPATPTIPRLFVQSLVGRRGWEQFIQQLESFIDRAAMARDQDNFVVYVLIVLYLSWFQADRLTRRGVDIDVHTEEDRIILVLPPGRSVSPGDTSMPGGSRRSSLEAAGVNPLDFWRQWASALLPQVSTGADLKDKLLGTFSWKYMLKLAIFETGGMAPALRPDVQRADRKVWTEFSAALDTIPPDLRAIENWAAEEKRELEAKMDDEDDSDLVNSMDDIYQRLDKIQTQARLLREAFKSLRTQADERGNPSVREALRALWREQNRLLGLLGSVTAAWRAMHTKQRRMRNQINRAIERGVVPLDVNAEAGDGGTKPVRAGWALRPSFTGRITLSAPAVAAINNAFSQVTTRFPRLSPSRIPIEDRHNAFKHTPVFSQLYANLVASHILLASIRFPRQWQLDSAYARAAGNQAGVLLRISSWVWGINGLHDTGERHSAQEREPRLGVGLERYLNDPTLQRNPALPPAPIPPPVWRTLTDSSAAPPGSPSVFNGNGKRLRVVSGAGFSQAGKGRKKTRTVRPTHQQVVDQVLQWTHQDVRDRVLQVIAKRAFKT